MSDELETRRQNLEALRARGEDPYPVNFEPQDAAADLHRHYADLEPASETGDEATVAGRLVGLRDMGKLAFGVLQDATGRIQLFIDHGLLGERAAILQRVDVGDWLGATGEIITTKKGELSVRVSELTLLAKSLRPLPEKWHGLKDLEQRSRRRYLDLIANADSRAVAEGRIATISSLRRSFEDRGFKEVETPVLHITPGGAIARPFETHHNALDTDMYLRIALELHLKRLVIGGMDRVFEIGRNFRNEGVDATHSPEFTMLEAYQAYADYHNIMGLVESVISEAAAHVTGSAAITYQGRQLDLAPPYRRVALIELVNEATGARLGFDSPIEDLRDLARGHGVDPDEAWGHGAIIFELFEHLVEQTIWDPTFVIDYPKEVSPLARVHRDDEDLTERFELFVAGFEVANAFSELNDPDEQRARFDLQAAARDAGDPGAHPVDEDFLLALEYGMPPTGGLGIGVDRLVMLLTDQAHIRDVQLFPHLRPEQ